MTSFPRVLIERDTDGEDSSSSSDDDGDEEEEGEPEHQNVAEIKESVVEDWESESKKKSKASITIAFKKVCKVCKRSGHEAGFRGATYVDCPMKPCFLCKMPGHTTIDCPHRVVLDQGAVPAPRRNNRSPLDYIFERQIQNKIPMMKPAFVIPDQVDCAVIRYHSRRITCLEFHPTNNNILLSGDKVCVTQFFAFNVACSYDIAYDLEIGIIGQLGVWDFVKVHEKTVYGNIHSCILNNMRFNPANDGTLFGASSDGTVSCTDLETGMSFPLMDINPNGWQGPSTWRMLYGMDTNSDKNVVLVADNFGYLYLVDMRSNEKMREDTLIHKRGTKVVGLHCHPIQPELLLSCGNDHFARIWDMRKLDASLASLHHNRVVNSAYFSPQSGSKILTTAQDNRIRVWDSIFGNLLSPSREIVHSHDFNRHLTPFRAEWDPKDPSESLAVIGRYISENYNGAALHPIDFFDTSTGQLVAEVTEPNITTISPVNKIHPRDEVMATGSSRSIFIWRPKDKVERVEEREDAKIVLCGGSKKTNKKFGGESDESDDDTFNSKGKNSKSKRDGKSGRSALTKVKAKPMKNSKTKS
ncbi:hypothetical protein Sjap_014084 [Stephania japonica]|uniref:Protein DAMAGED DNA-BINDING 2 n=1 Tax=Stephania japonica TaxID=461633 RepID=A0AAP0IZ06_9MAGN